jgi:NitT/TauT family transport system permease protein
MAVLAIAWQLLAQKTHSLLVPSFTGTVTALFRLLTTSQLWEALLISNLAMVLGFVLAAMVGVATGFVMGRWRVADEFFDPYLNILLVTPMSAAIPIIIMVLGLGLPSRVLVVFSFSFVTITVNTRAGLRMIEPDWIEMTRAFGGTERQLWLKVLSRGARPAILMGLRLGLIRAVAGMITMELLLMAVGVGRLILDFQSNFEAGSMYAIVLVVIAEAVLLARLCERLEMRATPWAGGAGIE